MGFSGYWIGIEWYLIGIQLAFNGYSMGIQWDMTLEIAM